MPWEKSFYSLGRNMGNVHSRMREQNVLKAWKYEVAHVQWMAETQTIEYRGRIAYDKDKNRLEWIVKNFAWYDQESKGEFYAQWSPKYGLCLHMTGLFSSIWKVFFGFCGYKCPEEWKELKIYPSFPTKITKTWLY